MPPVFNMDDCSLCGVCIEDCPGYILEMKENGPEVIYPEECWHCGSCRISCPVGCVSYSFPLTMLV
jgi:NAD-dependent dihydropyrimidine dehydrogenase PreA subunit